MTSKNEKAPAAEAARGLMKESNAIQARVGDIHGGRHHE